MGDIFKKLLEVQKGLKAPKGQYNSFGKYAYRSCEDILEAVKPLTTELGCVVLLTDDILNIGERYYVKATAKIIDAETGDAVENVAFAREQDTKKGMDDSQVTGSCSSYARKYALNGLFAIDDQKDADAQNQWNENSKKQNQKPSEAQLKRMWAIAGKAGIDENGVHAFIKQAFKKEKIGELTVQELNAMCTRLEKKGKSNG